MMTESEKPGRGEHLRYLLTAYVFESISEAGRREVEEHLAACAECRTELEELRETVASVEDAFAEESQGAAGYSFEARRLARVLAAGQARRAGGWLATWRKPVTLAAAAVLVIAVGVFLLSPTLMRGRQWHEIARRSEAPPLADTNLQGNYDPAVVTSYVAEIEKQDSTPFTLATDQPVESLEKVVRYDDSLGRPPTPPAAGTEADASVVAALPFQAPAEEKQVTLWAAPELAFEKAAGPGGGQGGGRAVVDANGQVVVDGIGVGGGAAGAHGQPANRARGVPAKGGAPVPATNPPPAEGLGTVPATNLSSSAGTTASPREAPRPARAPVPSSARRGATEVAQAGQGVVINEVQLNVQDEAAKAAGADRWGDQQLAGKPVDAGRRLGRESLSETEGAAALNAPADGTVRLEQRVAENSLALGEAAGLDARGSRSFGIEAKSQAAGEPVSQDKGIAQLYKEKEPAGERRLEELEVTKLSDFTQEVAAASDVYYETDLKRVAKKAEAGAKEVADHEFGAQLQGPVVKHLAELKQKADAPETREKDALRDLAADHDGEDASRSARLKVVQDRTQQGLGAQGWSFSVTRGDGGLPGLVAQDPSSVEGLLRGYAHYRALDQGLTLEGFSTRVLQVPSPTVGDEGLGQDGFRKRYGVNPFVDTRRDHFSTFGMDVDTASYTLARGALAAGKLPDPRQVRVEEFVNFFPEDVPASRDHVFSVRCEGGPAPFGEGLDLLKVTVKARDLLPGERKDAVLTFAVDTSGSMHEGNRLTLVREALSGLVRSLKPDDRVAVVGFSDHPYLVLPHTPAREADRILGAVESLTPRGDTNFEAGLALAYRVADEVLEPKAVHRVILCSDGVATAGARGAEEILKRVEVFAKRGIYLSCVGFGMGKYNDKLLETLADKGNGNYAYADDQKAAADVFQKNLPATLQVLAQDAKVQVDFNPEVVSNYRLVGYENRDIADKDFRNDKVDAGEVGPGTTVTVLYEVLRRPGSSGEIGKVHVRYKDTGTGRVDEESYPLPPGVIATRLAETSDRFRFIASAAETAELLRGSYWARNGSYGKVLAVLHGLGAGFRERPEWKELAALAARAQELTIETLQGN